MNKELHVTSLVLQIKPEHMSAVRIAIIAMENADVSVNNEIKLVVILEGDSTGSIMTDIDTINSIPGVVTADMVYHQYEVLDEGESQR